MRINDSFRPGRLTITWNQVAAPSESDRSRLGFSLPVFPLAYYGITQKRARIRAEVTVCSYIGPTAPPFTKALCQTAIVRAEQSVPLKKPSQVAQSNSRGTDCRNFVVVVSAAVDSCWPRCYRRTITVLREVYEHE